MAKLNDRQKRFCEEYMVDLNATQAAIRAGYSPRTAESQASDLLRVPKVADEISRLKAKQSRRSGVNADRVVREIGVIAFSEAELTRDKLKALELLARHIGLFDERQVQANASFADMIVHAWETRAGE